MSDETPQSGGEEAVPPVVVPSPIPPTIEGGGFRNFFPSGSGFASLRDLILFLVGLGVLADQVFLQKEISTIAVSIGAGMCGLPIVLRTDQKSR